MRKRTVIGLIVLAIVNCQSQAGELRPAQVDEGINKMLAQDAERWKQSVIKRDLDALVQFVSPEYRDGTKRELQNKDSLLFKALFTEPASVYQLLARRGANLETVLLTHDEYKDMGAGTTVCHFDRNRFKPQWPMTKEALYRLWQNPDVFCLFAYHTDGRWFMSYAFAEEDEGDEE